MRIGRGQGFGKLILFGEHAVVYGHRALAFGLERGAHAVVSRSQISDVGAGDGLRLRLVRATAEEVTDPRLLGAFEAMAGLFGLAGESLVGEVVLDVPASAGLGSSAALAVSLSRALADFAGMTAEDSEELVHRAVALSEGIFHGAASGIDQRAAMGGGLFSFRRLEGGVEVEPLVLGADVKLVVCQAEAGASTSELVAGVADFRAREPERVDGLLGEIGDISGLAVEALSCGDVVTLGQLMDLNHEMLRSLGVSTDALDRACALARDAGALGAKLTGAGGGGCVVALVENDAGGVLDAWKSSGLDGFEVVLAQNCGF